MQSRRPGPVRLFSREDRAPQPAHGRAVLLDRLVIVREERYLARKFGDECLSYKRRWR